MDLRPKKWRFEGTNERERQEASDQLILSDSCRKSPQIQTNHDGIGLDFAESLVEESLVANIALDSLDTSRNRRRVSCFRSCVPSEKARQKTGSKA